MLRFLLEGPIERALDRANRGPFVPALTGSIAFLLTVTMTVPVTAVLIPAVLVARRVWKSIVMLAAFGSAAGATILVLVFHSWGWNQIHAAFPTMLESQSWLRVIAWVGEWGAFGLFAVAALPLPQTPALLFFALAERAGTEVMLAVLAGKLVKYGVVAAAVRFFPERFIRFRRPIARRNVTAGS